MVRDYRWPGNLRELYAVLSVGPPATPGRIDITAADLPASLRSAAAAGGDARAVAERPLPLDALLEEAERRLIDMAIRRSTGNKTRAAEILEIWRTRLIRRMKALGLGDAEADDSGEE